MKKEAPDIKKISDFLNTQKFETILNNMSEGLLEIDLNGKILYSNRAASIITGTLKKELLLSNFLMLIDNTEKNRFKKFLQSIDKIKQPFEEKLNTIIKDKNIELKILPFDKTPNQKEKKTIKNILIFLKDITEQKKSETQLERSQKMEAMGTLASGVAHDFNNLLTAIQGNISLILMDIDSKHSQYKRISNIEKYIGDSTELARQLLSYSRKKKDKIESICLNELIIKTSQMFGRTKKEIKIYKNCQKNLWGVEVNQGQIEQVLLNLFVNAWQAMPEGGNLYIETENLILDELFVKPFSLKSGKYVKLSITDTGTGMDKSTCKNIFKPFFTTKNADGTGLGLATVNNILKKHESIIKVSSRHGEGTTFNIYIPASDRKLKKKITASGKVIKGKGTILLIDDEDIIISIGSQLLEMMGYNVITAENGRQGIEIFKKRYESYDKKKLPDPRYTLPDLVILDMIMPDINGQEVYDRLKKIKPDVKVLLSSGYGRTPAVDDILKRGGDGFVQKPFRIKNLSKAIRKIIDSK